MSCPRPAEWPSLVAHRFDPRGQEPAGWPEALAHLAGCAECRRAALAADPTLLFHGLAGRGREPEPARGPARERADVAEMQRAVAAMRRASRLDGAARRPSRLAAGKRWAAAAVLALAALSTGRSWRDLPELPAGTVESLAVPAAPAAALPATGGSRLPMIEELNRPDARVYEIDAPGISMAMIFDEGLDV